jgi:hypothetical protein
MANIKGGGTGKNKPLIRVSDEGRSARYRRRKMQRMLEKNPKLLEELTKQMLLNGWKPDGYDDLLEPSDEEPAS